MPDIDGNTGGVEVAAPGQARPAGFADFDSKNLKKDDKIVLIR